MEFFREEEREEEERRKKEPKTGVERRFEGVTVRVFDYVLAYVLILRLLMLQTVSP